MIATAVIAVFVWVLGLCVGSFLNVVLYRLPREMSIASPARSFCPHCRTQIAAWDNLPVLSWLLLRGRCRACRVPIAAQYPLVEALTGLCFVLVYRLLFIDTARFGVDYAMLPTDAALLIAWLVLVAALVACAGMDLVSYMVDTRITDVALLVGLVGYALWPRPEFYSPRIGALAAPASLAAGAAALAALLVSAVMLWRTVWRGGGAAPAPPDAPAGHEPPAPAAAAPARPQGLAGVLAILVFVGLAACLVTDVFMRGIAGAALAGSLRASLGILCVPAALLALFIACVVISGQHRAADRLLSDALEEERSHARRVVLGELTWLSPIIAFAAAAFAAVWLLPDAAAAWSAAVGWSPFGGLTPLGGLTFAAHGAMVAALAGWVLRIGFTLLFGREALGTGDIFILAAAGAAGGWDIALLGLLLSVAFALAGWLLTLLLKRSAILSFGPWLALGFVAALWLSRPAAGVARYYGSSIALAWEQDRMLVLLMAGVMLLGTGVAVVAARLVRVVAERATAR